VWVCELWRDVVGRRQVVNRGRGRRRKEWAVLYSRGSYSTNVVKGRCTFSTEADSALWLMGSWCIGSMHTCHACWPP
jgi:hypothetical protein